MQCLIVQSQQITNKIVTGTGLLIEHLYVQDMVRYYLAITALSRQLRNIFEVTRQSASCP